MAASSWHCLLLLVAAIGLSEGSHRLLLPGSALSYIGTENKDESPAGAVMANGNAAIAFRVKPVASSASEPYILLETTRTGGVVWATQLDIAGQRIKPLSIKANVAGEFVTAGYTQILGSTDRTGYVAKFSSAGALLWTQSIPAGTFTSVTDIAFTSDSGIVVVGYSIRDGSQTSYKAFAMKFD